MINGVKNRFKKIIVVMVFALGLEQTTKPNEVERAVGITAGVALVATSGYLAGRLTAWSIYKLALRRYEPELDLLARSFYNDHALQEELVPYILDRHDRINSFYFIGANLYKNFPLLHYKNDLDWYITRLWMFKLFCNAAMRNEMTRLYEKLERVRRIIVTDYRFVQEQRQFDRDYRKK